MTREAELRDSVKKIYQVDDDLLNHLITHIKLRLSDNCPDATILRLIAHDEYTQHLTDSFISDIRRG